MIGGRHEATHGRPQAYVAATAVSAESATANHVPATARSGHRDYKTTLIYADYAPLDHEGELVERAFRPG
jgi:hypothetical protein